MATWPIDRALGAYNSEAVDAFGANTGGRTFPHTGSDFRSYGARSIPVYATEGGRVIRSGYNGSTTGHYVIVQQPSGFWMYAHLAKRQVVAGQIVVEGQRLGMMGNTGRSSGVHLHITRFMNLKAALANGIPTRRLKGESLASWAAKNYLGDPIAVINGGKSATTTTPSAPTLTPEQQEEAELMAAKDEIKTHTQNVVNNLLAQVTKYVDERIAASEWRNRREVRMRLIYVEDYNGQRYTLDDSPRAAAISLSGGGILRLVDGDRSGQIASLKQNYLTVDEREQAKGMDFNSFMNQVKDIAQAQENVNAICEGRTAKTLTQKDVAVSLGWE